MRVHKIIGWVFIGIAGAAALGLILGLVVQFLWNTLMPTIFGLPEISYWQAVAIFILCHLLFGGHHPPPQREPGRYPGHPFARRVHSMMRSMHQRAESTEADMNESGMASP